jgi:hypothetical protein
VAGAFEKCHKTHNERSVVLGDMLLDGGKMYVHAYVLTFSEQDDCVAANIAKLL